MTDPVELTSLAAAAAIAAAVSIVTEVARPSLSRNPSKEVSNHLAVRTGELARIILESFYRDPADVVVASTDPLPQPEPPRSTPSAQPVLGGVGW